jgi:sugar phosphate isomerase/epimerase
VKLGVIALNLVQFEFEEGLKYAHDLGLHAVEVGACGLARHKKFCDPDKLVADKGELRRWLDAFASHGLEISALSGHGAPLMPDKEIAREYSKQFRQACELMESAEIRRMTLLAGLPEGAEGDRSPSWVTFADLPFLRDTLEWQWEKRLIPYWREQGKIAADHGVTLCFEMHGGDLIHNPVTLMRLREEIGPVVACNFDISHLWFQGIDPIEALRHLGNLVQHVHAKDTQIHPHNVRLRGFHDSSSSEHPELRPWTFTIPGWGHDEAAWREFVTTLRFIGYDHVLSIEMECDYINVQEGLEKSVAFLKPIVLEKPAGSKWWQLAGMSSAGSLWQDTGKS